MLRPSSALWTESPEHVRIRGLRPPFFMSADRYDFYDDDWYDGAALMTIEGRREQLERIFAASEGEDAN